MLSGVAGCPDRVSAPQLPVLRSVLAGAAAAALQPNGEFVLASAPAGLVTAEQARALSLAYGRTAGPAGLGATWEWERNAGPIDYAQLRPCGRTFFARTTFDALPPTAILPLRQRFGSFWLTTLCGAAGDPEVSVAVPVVDTLLRVTADGMITDLGTAHFSSAGIQPGVKFPPSPETVAQEVAQQTQRRVTQVPELILQPPPYMPQLAKWRIELEAPASFQTLPDTTQLTRSEVYYGYGHVVQIIGLQVGQACEPTRFVVPVPGTVGDSIMVSLAPGYDNCYSRVDTAGQRTAVRQQ